MTGVYIDTSAAVKLLVEEAESAALAEYLDQQELETFACLLLETELRRFAVRHDIPQAEVTAILDAISLYDMPHSLYYEAGILAGRNLRSLDALHLAAAVRLGAHAMLCYDDRLMNSAEELGLEVLAISSTSGSA
jgi:predicted nucleic acid-binding protein